MTLIALLTAFAFAQENATSIDIDGDGKGDAVVLSGEQATIGGHKVECYPEDGMCTIHEADITSGNKQKEAIVCNMGPRDDKYCAVYTLSGGKLVQVAFDDDAQATASEISLKGNGFMYTTEWAHRLYYRTAKYKWNGTKMVSVPQPIFTVSQPQKLHVEKTFKLLQSPGSSDLVGNTRPDSDIFILGEHGQKEGWMLVRLSSGISGWVHKDTLAEVSMNYQMTLSAG